MVKISAREFRAKTYIRAHLDARISVAFILENNRTAGFIGSTWKKGHVAAAQERISMLGLAA